MAGGYRGFFAISLTDSARGQKTDAIESEEGVFLLHDLSWSESELWEAILQGLDLVVQIDTHAARETA